MRLVFVVDEIEETYDKGAGVAPMEGAEDFASTGAGSEERYWALLKTRTWRITHGVHDVISFRSTIYKPKSRSVKTYR
jgi:hypothetical protein